MILFKNTIKNIIKLLIVNKRRFFLNIFEIITTILLIFESGFLFLKFGAPSRIKMIALIALFAFILIIYLSKIDYSKVIEIVKNKKVPKPSFAFVFLIFLSFVILLSFLFNNSKNLNLFSYLDLMALLWSSVLLIKAVDFKRFCNIYIKAVSTICVIALVFYFVVFFVDIPFAKNLYFHDSYIIEDYSGLFFDYSTNIVSFAPASKMRMMGMFWEPGVFASHILIALVIDFMTNKKISLFRLLICLSCLLLTFSTAAYIIMPIVALVFISERTKRKNNRTIILSLSIIALFLAIVAAFVIFKNKLLVANSSLLTRLLSPKYVFLTFLKKPFFGHGPVSANYYYYELVARDSQDITAMTSMPGYLCSSIGIFAIAFVIVPIIGIFKEKELSLFTRVLLVVFVVLMTNKENQSSIYSIFIFYLYFGLKNLRFKWENKSCNVALENSVIGKFLFKSRNSVKSNVSWAMIVKILAMVLGIVSVPVFNTFFGNNEKYGVWLTMISILSWILMFDFGFSNGLRTKLTEALQRNDKESIKRYLSGTYQVSLFLSSMICIVGSILAFTLNWNSIYNIAEGSISRIQLSSCMMIILCSVGIQFGLRPILAVLESLKKSALANSLSLFSNFFLLIMAIFLGTTKVAGNYIIFSIIYFICINVPLIIGSVWVYKYKLSDCKPSLFVKFDYKVVKGLMGLNAIFFLIQISYLMLYGINSIMISNMYGPDLVADYTKYYKLFSTIENAFTGVFQAPMWVAVAQAKEMGDFEKIKKLQKTSLLIGLVFSLLSIVLFVSLPLVFNVWLGDQSPNFSWIIASVFLVDNLIKITACSFTIIGNGLSAVKSQAIVYSVAAILKIPLAILYKMCFYSQFSFTTVILAEQTIIWIALILIPLEIRTKVKFLEEKRIKQGEIEI